MLRRMDTSTPNRTANAAKTFRTPAGSGSHPEDPARGRRAALLVLAGVSMMLVSLLWPGATLSHPERDGVVYGGSGADEMWASDVGSAEDGASVLEARAGDDEIYGGAGVDVIDAGAGDDFVEVSGGGRDRVTCGSGIALVNADSGDIVAADCETVYVTPLH